MLLLVIIGGFVWYYISQNNTNKVERRDTLFFLRQYRMGKQSTTIFSLLKSLLTSLAKGTTTTNLTNYRLVMMIVTSRKGMGMGV